MRRRGFLVLCVGLLLAGCGGGGGSSNGGRFQPPESPDGIARVRRVDPKVQRINRPRGLIDVYIENTTQTQLQGATLRFGGSEHDFAYFHNGTATQWRVRFGHGPVNPAWEGQSLPVEITLSDGTAVVQDVPPALVTWLPPN